jgi:hypothetical protein
MSARDHGVRALSGLAAIAVAVLIGAGSAGQIVLFAFAAAVLATSAIGFRPLYRLIRFDSRGRRPLPH